jgi:flagellar basal-body rod modification protein FlgD
MVDSVNSSTSGISATSSLAASSTDIGATQDRFLKLLVTQMKNQDPLNPMDNAQVTSQMAQLSTVTGIDKLNSTVQALSSSMMASQSLQAVSMIGHVALTDGDGMSLANGNAYGGVELAQPADKVTVQITNAAGAMVRTLHLGAQESGVVDFSWDGMTDTGSTAADGKYTFTAASELSGKKSDVTTLSYGLVNSVAQSSSGITVNIGDQGEVGLNTIRKIL